jgi:hypothetical protein
MRNVISIVSVGLIGGGALLACSSSSGGSSVSATQAASDIAKAFCAKVNTCSPLGIQVAFGDLAGCESRESALFAEALGASGTGWTPSAVEACAQTVAGASCDDAMGHNLPSACHAPAGQLASGAACGDNAQCASGYCNLGAGNKCGTCAAGVGSANASCYRDDDCAYGTLCVGSDLTASPAVAGHCTAPGASGATCDTSHPCLKTLACKSGTCAAPDATGASCTTNSCGGLAGDYCSNAMGGTCTKVLLAASGQPCGLVNGTYTACSGAGTCPMTGTTKTCVAPAADFANCNAANGPGCTSPAECIGGICTRPSPATCH